MAEETFVAVSGGFDPLHVGHLRMFFDAASFGKLIVILNSDEWLIRKKGYCFMSWHERRELLMHYRFVHGVVAASDDDGTVCTSLLNLSKTLSYFGNGGDRAAANTPELALCEKLGIPVIFGLGGPKIQSSSELVKKIAAGFMGEQC
jgi:cytidyltransferase-like protein